MIDYFPQKTAEVVEKGVKSGHHLDVGQVRKDIQRLEKEMREKANALDFEQAAKLRDEMKKLQEIEIMLT